MEVSIIVPVFNAARTVSSSLNSLFNQTLQGMEIIVVDDGSSDESAALVEDLTIVHPNLRLVRLPANVGVHEARAEGIRQSRGAWIGFMDSDDYARPEMFGMLLDRCLSTCCDIAVCSVELVDSDRRRIAGKVAFKYPEAVDSEILDRFCRLEFGTGALWNKLYRREVILPHALRSFRWRQDATEDTLVNIGCFHDARRITLMPEILYEYVIHPASATQSLRKPVAFCRQLRAFAVAIDAYGGLGDEVVRAITELYRRQIEYDCHQIDDLTSLSDQAEGVSEAVSLLVSQAPIALASVIARRPHPDHGQRSASGLLRDGLSIARALPSAILAAARRRW